MKIAVVSNLYPPFVVGGYEQLCRSVSGELADRGHELVILTSTYGGRHSDDEEKVIERNLRLLTHEDDIYRPFNASPVEREEINAKNRSVLEDFFSRHKPDIWFVWNLYFFDNDLIDVISRFGVPVTLFLTDNWIIAAKQPEELGRFFGQFVHGDGEFCQGLALSESIYSGAQRAIFGSRFVRDLYRAFNFQFQSETVIHNGVQLPIIPDEFFVDRGSLREAGRLKLLFAGRIVEIKGLQTIIRALPMIKSALELDVRLTVVGDTQDRAFADLLKKEIAENSCGDLIDFRQPVKESLLMPLFNDHDIYLFPSLYEPFSLTLIHALASGIPTVASAVGGNAEIVEDGRTGLLFKRNSFRELADAVIRLARDQELRQTISVNGRRVARRFTFRRMISRIEADLSKAAGTAQSESESVAPVRRAFA